VCSRPERKRVREKIEREMDGSTQLTKESQIKNNKIAAMSMKNNNPKKA
jgi:hypothetical protein